MTANVFPVVAQKINTMPEVTNGQVNEALNNLTPVRFLPNNPLYFLIRGKEIISRFFKPSFRERAQFDYTISSKRLKEVYLLLNRGDVKKASSELDSYATTLERVEGQLEKAKSQNQDVTTIVDKISDNLRFQEVILVKLINLKSQDQLDFGDQLGASLNSFNEFVIYLDKIKPGVQNRFQLFLKQEADPSPSPVQSPIHFPTSVASPQIVPRRIIY